MNDRCMTTIDDISNAERRHNNDIVIITLQCIDLTHVLNFAHKSMLRYAYYLLQDGL